MLILHYNKYDESTDEYETGPVVHSEIDPEGRVTIYTGNGSWYITLEPTDYEIVCTPEEIP